MHQAQPPSNDLIIDWNLALRLAGNKHELAKDILHLLARSLPDDIKAIRLALTKKNFTALMSHAHKLHGALSYCGVPRLKNAMATLETALKKQEFARLNALVNQAELEAKLVLEKTSEIGDAPHA